MNCKVEVLFTFKKEFKRLSKWYRSLLNDVQKLQGELLAKPDLGTDLGNGLRKIRMAIQSKGKGKSGGARVITYTIITKIEETEINLLYIYDKSERDSISAAEIKELLKQNGFL